MNESFKNHVYYLAVEIFTMIFSKVLHFQLFEKKQTRTYGCKCLENAKWKNFLKYWFKLWQHCMKHSPTVLYEIMLCFFNNCRHLEKQLIICFSNIFFGQPSLSIPKSHIQIILSSNHYLHFWERKNLLEKIKQKVSILFCLLKLCLFSAVY